MADYIQRVARFLPVRSKPVKHFEEQVYIECKDMNIKLLLSQQNVKLKQNNKQMLNAKKKKLASSQLNNTSDNIIHLFTTKRFAPEQEYDLVNFRDIGQEGFENRVNY